MIVLIPSMTSKNYNVILEPIAEELRKLFEEGVEIYDADIGRYS